DPSTVVTVAGGGTGKSRTLLDGRFRQARTGEHPVGDLVADIDQFRHGCFPRFKGLDHDPRTYFGGHDLVHTMHLTESGRHPEEPTSVTWSTSSTDKVDNRRPRTPCAHPTKASTQQEGPPRHVTVRTGQGRRRTRHPSHVAPTHRRCTPCPAGRTCDPCGQPPCADRP